MIAYVRYSVAGAIERLGGAVCSLHRACGDEERGFLG
jgi:hypothetical protein